MLGWVLNIDKSFSLERYTEMVSIFMRTSIYELKCINIIVITKVIVRIEREKFTTHIDRNHHWYEIWKNENQFIFYVYHTNTYTLWVSWPKQTAYSVVNHIFIDHNSYQMSAYDVDLLCVLGLTLCLLIYLYPSIYSLQQSLPILCHTLTPCAKLKLVKCC